MQIIGEEWAVRKGIAGPPLLPYERQPCPICGHPTMDCIVDQHVAARQLAAGINPQTQLPITPPGGEPA